MNMWLLFLLLYILYFYFLYILSLSQSWLLKLVPYQIIGEPAASTDESVYDQSTMTAVSFSADNLILMKRQIDDKGSRVI